MATVTEHYDQLLAKHYTWMSGGFEPRRQENEEFFVSNGILPKHSKNAIDLGAGSGFQSVALANLGFDVLAIDLNSTLLSELENHRGHLSIRTIQADLIEFEQHGRSEYGESNVELVVCMGDTLTHLSSYEEVVVLCQKVSNTLMEGGRFILSFRDLTPSLETTDRFIPIKSDAHRIFSCFLEYEPNHVNVHDLVYQQTDGEWKIQKSVYRKLRIGFEWMKGQLEKCGFYLELAEHIHGRINLVAQLR